MKLNALLPLTALLISPILLADDWPDFDRPGILFAADVLPAGVWSLELGVPEISRNTTGQNRMTAAELHSMLRFGLVENWELQFDMAPYIRERIKTTEGTVTQDGYSDARIGLRYDASAIMADWFHANAVAIQTGVTLDSGHADFTESDNEIDLGIVASWQITADGHEVDAMVQWLGSNSNSSWFLASTYGAPVNDDLTAFIEVGAWFGDLEATVAGAGIIWRPSAGFQVDSYILQRLSGDITDTQLGLGVSWMFF